VGTNVREAVGLTVQEHVGPMVGVQAAVGETMLEQLVCWLERLGLLLEIPLELMLDHLYNAPMLFGSWIIYGV